MVGGSRCAEFEEVIDRCCGSRKRNGPYSGSRSLRAEYD